MESGGPELGLDGVAEQVFGFGVVRRLCEVGDDAETCLTDHNRVRESWKPGIEFRLQSASSETGLRRAQLGAIHAVLAHWSTGSIEPATVVLPTGTGKTETMLALLVEARLRRLLVVVPSDALRSQLAKKFESLGLLGPLGVLPESAMRPSVGRLTARTDSTEEIRAFTAAAQVIISTPNALSSMPSEVRQALFEACDAVLFDEAHHVGIDLDAESGTRSSGEEGRPVHSDTLPRGRAAPSRALRLRLPAPRGPSRRRLP